MLTYAIGAPSQMGRRYLEGLLEELADCDRDQLNQFMSSRNDFELNKTRQLKKSIQN